MKLRSAYGVNLIAIKRKVIEKDRKKEQWNVNPSPDDVILNGDLLVLVGHNRDLEKL